MTSFKIGSQEIGTGFRPYVIAELSGNHNGDINRIFALIDAAKQAGADAIKIQTYTADTMTIDCDLDDFMISGGPWDGYRLYDLYTEAHTPWEWHHQIFDRCNEIGITVFSTPFDHSAVDFLQELGAPAYKVASFEMTDLPLLEKIASTGKPVIMSTGLASISEISESVDTLRKSGCHELAILHCVSGYPSDPADANLRTIPNMAEIFQLPVGLSDHSTGIGVSVAAVSQGAAVIEKHLTLRRSDGGVDSEFSLEPDELRLLTEGCLAAYQSLGRVNYSLTASEAQNYKFRRSIYAVRDIAKGETLTGENIRTIRPGFGLAPKFMPRVLGRTAAKDIQRGTPLSLEMVGLA